MYINKAKKLLNNEEENKMNDTITCSECKTIISKADALEYEYCIECEECLEIPDNFYEEEK